LRKKNYINPPWTMKKKRVLLRLGKKGRKKRTHSNQRMKNPKRGKEKRKMIPKRSKTSLTGTKEIKR